MTQAREQFQELLSYDENTGRLFWKQNVSRKVKAGDVAGCYTTKGVRIRLQGINWLAHRIVWILMKGELPEQIDHIDGNPLNNRLANLRAATSTIQNRNKKKLKTNTTGFAGVSRSRRKSDSYRAQICVDKRQIHLGDFPTAESAAKARAAYVTAHPELGFTERHGK